MSIFGKIIAFAITGAFTWYVGRLWIQWVGQREQPGRGWRPSLTVVGLFATTVSTILSIFLFLHAQVTGGYPFYHPIELFCIRWGTLTALVGIAASIVGKGKVRPHLAVVSVINLLIWFSDATAQ